MNRKENSLQNEEEYLLILFSGYEDCVETIWRMPAKLKMEDVQSFIKEALDDNELERDLNDWDKVIIYTVAYEELNDILEHNKKQEYKYVFGNNFTLNGALVLVVTMMACSNGCDTGLYIMI